MKELEAHSSNSNYVLHENKAGYIIQCKDCEEILISFGSIVTSVNEIGFINLHTIK